MNMHREGRKVIRDRFRAVVMTVAVVFVSTTGAAADSGLTILDENPRYFALDGKPLFLASKSFGWTAVSDPVFDYVRDIETMADHGGNLLRLTLFWPGHGEDGGTLPWLRDEATGRYDLDAFNPKYFERLRHYLEVARTHEAVVNLELFDHPAVKGGSGRWPTHPMNPEKNINYGEGVFGTSSADRTFFRTLPEHDNFPEALHFQEALVRKVLDETLDFDHIIYSLGNECVSPVEWNRYWVSFIRAHAADRDAAPPLVTNMWRHDLPEFDVFDIHDADSPYRVRRADARQMWSAYQALYARQEREGQSKPIYDSGQMGGAPGSFILHQLWMSFVGGTAGMRYHRLAPVHPRPGISTEVEWGNWEDPFFVEQQRWVQNLRTFIEGMEFWTMEPLWNGVADGEGYLFARPGDIYVLYMPNGGEVTLAEAVPPGTYTLRWFEPDTGEFEEPQQVTVEEGAAPPHIRAPSAQDWVLLARRE